MAQEVCVGNRHFSDLLPQGFDFSAKTLNLRDAYWMSVLAFDAYLTKDVALSELGKLGLMNSQFFDEDGIARNFLLFEIDFQWASSQGYWTERPDGAVLAFRGTSRGELVDIITDLWSAQGTLTHFGDLPVDPSDEEVRIHKGFWYALEIVWKDIEHRAKDFLATERPKERQAKEARLDQLAARMSAIGEAALKTELAQDTDWRIDPAGKINFLKTWKQLGADQTKRDELFEFLDQNWVSWQKPLFITGHSLGGGLATIAAYRLMKMGLNVTGLYTFGSPRVGNGAFVRSFLKLAHRRTDGGIYRFVNHNDAVARVPPPLGLFGVDDNVVTGGGDGKWEHASTMLYLTGDDAATQELWPGADVPSVLGDLPLENWQEWGADHNPRHYPLKLEQLAFGTQTPCP
jgi:hypothetical protein